MEIIKKNPYRIAGILSNATARELQRQKTKITAYTKVGKEIKSDFDFEILDSISRTEESVNKAFSQIEQNQDKVNYSLFWFLNANPFDNTAIEYLKKGNEEKALEIWEKVTNDKEVNPKNFSAFNNLGTCKLLSNNQTELKKGIEAKIKLIESDYFENFVHSVADETYTIDKQKQSEKLIDELLNQFKNQYSSSETMELFSTCNGTTQQYLSKKFTEQPLHNIESQIESCKKKRKSDSLNGYKLGLKLLTSTKEDLLHLKSLIGNNDLNYKTIADQLANEIMQCGIDYFNASQENDSNEDFLKQAQELNKAALSIAVGRLIQDRAKDHITTLEEIKDEVIVQTNALLQSVKDAYETNKQNILQQVEDFRKENEIFFHPKLGPHSYSINQSAVEENIKNSIDWTKVNELLREVLPIEILSKIKASSNYQLKTEFIELAYWLMEHSQSSNYISTIIGDYKKIKPKLTFEILSSEITNTDNKPLFTKFIRYIGLKLNIQVIEDSEITFHLKYINPKGRVDRNTKSSPKGYTRLDTKTLGINDTSINFSGWGNSEKCTYAIGEHRIEVYVDEYLIHTEKYRVDLVPSERIGKELSAAESRLRKINQTNYLENEIKVARNRMSEIQKFQLFRGSSEKQRQINEQQTKIDQLIAKSKNKKRRNIKSQEEKIYKLKMELSASKY